MFYETIKFLTVENILQLSQVCKQWYQWIDQDFGVHWKKLQMSTWKIEKEPQIKLGGMDYLRQIVQFNKTLAKNETYCEYPDKWKGGDLSLEDDEDFCLLKEQFEHFVHINLVDTVETSVGKDST